MRRVAKVLTYVSIFLVHAFTIYHIHYQAGFLEETVLAFTVGFMKGSDYQFYLNCIFDVFYCSLLAAFFFSRRNLTSTLSDVGKDDDRLDPEAMTASSVTIVSEQRNKNNNNNDKKKLNLGGEKKSRIETQGSERKEAIRNKDDFDGKEEFRNKDDIDGKEEFRNKDDFDRKDSKTTKNSKSKNRGKSRNKTRGPGFVETKSGAEDAGAFERQRRRHADSVTLENGAAKSAVTSTWTPLGVVDVVVIGFVFPLVLLTIYLAWNLQTSVEVSWLSWRWLWGWWLERWWGWRFLCVAAAMVGITVWVRPRKGGKKMD